MPELTTELLYEMEIGPDLDRTEPIGETPWGSRRTVYTKGGTFEGPDTRGEVLPGGGDWIVRRPDGVTVFDVRGTLRTDDGALIYYRHRGLAHNLPVRPADSADEERYYRIAPIFETGDERYAWLNRIIAAGEAWVEGGRVHFRVYAIR